MIIPMYKVSITGLRDDFLQIAKVLHDNQVFQIGKFKHSLILDLENKSSYSSFKEIISLQNELNVLKTSLENLSNNILTANLELMKDDRKRFSSLAIEDIPTSEKQFKEFVNNKIQEITENYPKYQERITELKKILTVHSLYKDYSANLEPILKKLSKDTTFKYTIFVLEKSESLIEQLMNEIKVESKDPVELYLSTMSETYLVLVVFAHDLSPVHKVVGQYRIMGSETNFDVLEQPVKRMIIEIKFDQIKQLNKEILELQGKINNIILENKPVVDQLIQLINEKLSLTELVNYVKLTRYTFTIFGYFPKTKMKFFQEDLKTILGERVNTFINKVDTRDENVPILRKIPNIIKPFALFSDLLGKPKYGSYDAIFLIAFFWPFYWGFMVGDVGYALATMILAFILNKRINNEGIRQLSLILIYTGFIAAFFGVVYGEFFGDIPLRIFKIIHIDFHPLFDRSVSILEYLVITLNFAYFIMMLSILLGLLNGIRMNDPHMIKISASTLIMLFAIGLIVIDGIFLHLSLFYPMMIIILLSILSMIWFEGIKGIFQPLEIFTNVLSFARLMAIGLVGIIIANIANMFIFDGILGIIGIPFGFALHVLNFGIIILSPSIQALRLNMYEFMSHFYQGGGTEYKPFGNIAT
ncbi:MAG: V-type ATP synthase subunit I [Candidatus Thorarchaeota archaeon]